MDSNSSRRQFMRESLTTAAVAGGAGACMCSLAGCASKTPQINEAYIKRNNGQVVLDLANIPELATVGGAARLSTGKTSLIVIRTDEEHYAALSNKCTHFGRPVDYDAAAGKLVCSSFSHSAFDLDGTVLKGPAKKALACYETALADGKLTITL